MSKKYEEACMKMKDDCYAVKGDDYALAKLALRAIVELKYNPTEPEEPGIMKRFRQAITDPANKADIPDLEKRLYKNEEFCEWQKACFQVTKDNFSNAQWLQTLMDIFDDPKDSGNASSVWYIYNTYPSKLDMPSGKALWYRKAYYDKHKPRKDLYVD
jgi:hypothetical protein